MEDQFVTFLKEFEEKVIPLFKKSSLAYFNATVSGKKEDYKEASDLEIELSRIFSDKDDFRKLKEFRDSGSINDPILKRQLELIYNEYAGSQFDEELHEKIITLSNKIEEKFSTFRVDINGKKITDNQIDEFLDSSRDSEQLQKYWEASKQIGRVVEEDVKNLVRMRNDSARQLGYDNYHRMSLNLNEQESEEIEHLFDELDELTRESFTDLKSDIDRYLSDRCKVPSDKLMPWHYQDKFFQQGPKIYKVNLDKYYKDKDIVGLTRNYYAGIGLPIDDLIRKSDLFEKPGKYQHAYCTDIDRKGDVRVLCNIKPNHRWMATMLHEFGHAVYDKFVSNNLPWQLRRYSHIFTTEAVAMLFGRFASNPFWLRDVVGITLKEAELVSSGCFNSLRAEQLTFSRWVQVMYRFEKAMYEDPEQELNSLWWDLVEKYQMIKKPAGRNEPDWAAKIHVALYPAYYHNYMLGELLASQLYHYIVEKVIPANEISGLSFNNIPDVGEYLKNLFFAPGALHGWNELIIKSTGEELTPKYYAEQFV